jgi:predicted transcriptional regulator
MKNRRSKLEMYLAILDALGSKGPLKRTHLMYKANINCSILSEHIDFLIKQDLIEKHIVEKERVVFSITKRGMNVLKYFRELKQVLPIIEESRSQSTSFSFQQISRT